MRTEQEMMDLILRTAERDERIRAVVLEGSRANPNVPGDVFQDYDIGYIVTEVESFIHNPDWVDVFGERIVTQTPALMSLFPSEEEMRFSWLMLFTDGNRIDLNLIPLDEKDAYCHEDKLRVIVMDKDSILPNIPPSTDQDYWVRRPSAKLFADCCNEFWWVSAYVAKGLWRKEILYAQDYLNNYVRPMLLKMLEWQVGMQNNYKINAGKSSKYLEKYLSTENWKQLLSTYANGDYQDVWRALFAMTDLFRLTAIDVAANLDVEYNTEEDVRVTEYLNHIRELPDDAVQIY